MLGIRSGTSDAKGEAGVIIPDTIRGEDLDGDPREGDVPGLLARGLGGVVGIRPYGVLISLSIFINMQLSDLYDMTS